jgi:tripartite-type tricarboxylate transporter receptor subunit TctC
MLALTGSRASIFAPEIPTAASLGINGLPFGGWFGVFVPSTTPVPLTTRISADLNAVMQSPDIIQRLKDQYIEPIPPSMTTPFADFVRSEITFWEKTARSLNLYRTE